MKFFIRKGLPAAVTAIALGSAGTATGGAVYALRAESKTERAAPPPPSPSPVGGRVTSVVPPTEQPAALKRVIPPDFLVVGSSSLTPPMLDKVRGLPRVRDVITVDAGAVQLQGGRVNMFAVDASRFRAWTPPGTASNNKLWGALAQDQFVVSDEVKRQLSLREGMQYPVWGRTQVPVTMGGSGPLGLPGINVLVSKSVGQRLGLIRGIALLVNAPGGSAGKLNAGLRTVLGSQGQVIDLHARHGEKANQPPQQGGAPRERAGSYLELYKRSAGLCTGLSWTVLAAIGQIESDHGRNNGPSSAGALGPMQFMPATWRRYGMDGDGDGKADIMNPYDAVPAAAKYLCASGAPHDMRRAVFAYNHSQQYVNSVLSLARAYAGRYG